MASLFSSLFGGLLGGVGDLVTGIKDDNLKRAAIQVSLSAAYSQYITGLYTLGKGLEGKRFVGIFARPLQMMAASLYRLLQFQKTESNMYLAVPKELSTNAELLESIELEQEKK